MMGIRRTVWILHWVALVATPIWWAVGSSLTGGGWGFLFAAFLTVPAFVFLLIGPIVGVASRRLRTDHAMPPVYSVLTLVQWVFGFVWPLTIRMASDMTTGDSALGALGIPESVVNVVGVVSLGGYALSQLAALVSLVAASISMPMALTAREA